MRTIGETAPGPATTDGGPAFDVVLRRTGVTLHVPVDRTLLEVVEEVVTVDFTCRRGECGSCVTTVLEGVPEHRNTVLSARARQAGRRIALCVDRARTPHLVLDL